MAFFKFRKGGDEQAAPAQPESVEVMRRRARHRLIGAAVLVLIGVVGFPVLFDTQPRPMPVDIPIDIPDKAKVKPLVIPAAQPAALAASGDVVAVAPAPVAAPAPAPAAAPAPAPAPVSAAASLSPKEEVISGKADAKPATPSKAVAAGTLTPAPAEPKVAPKPEPKTVAKADPKPEPKPAPAKPVDDGAKAKALLEGKSVDTAAPAAADSGRFVVQVGAFADAAKAREVRLKVEKAGLKTYTHEANTKEGKRIRVRVGPFANRADADRAAAKVKGLDLPASVLTL